MRVGLEWRALAPALKLRPPLHIPARCLLVEDELAAGRTKRAELAISIGEKDCWSRGLGTDAVRTVLRHGFEDLGLRRVDLHTDADNARGIRCYEKCGFVREGVMRARRLRYGEPLDMVLMAVLRDEWQVDSER